MSMIDPTKIKFESQSDVIDYVTRGLPPKRKDFEAVMHAVRDQDAGGENHVTIAPGVEFDIDRDALANALDRAYQNRCHNRRILMGAGIVIGALVIAGGVSQHGKIKDLEAENDRLSEIIGDNLPEVDMNRI